MLRKVINIPKLKMSLITNKELSQFKKQMIQLLVNYKKAKIN